MPVNYVEISGKDISDIADRIEEAVVGYPAIPVAMSCYVVAVLCQRPDIAPDQLQECVTGISEYVSAFLFGKEKN